MGQRLAQSEYDARNERMLEEMSLACELEPAEADLLDHTVTEHPSQEDKQQPLEEVIVLNTTKPDSEADTSQSKMLVDRQRSEDDVI